MAMESTYILEALNITKKFPGVTALNNVSINVKKGEILGLIGENGAGKSTLLKILNGIYPHSSFDGQISIDGSKVEFQSPHDAKLKGIGFVPQETSVLDNLTVAENIYVGDWSVSSKNKGFVSFSKLKSSSEKLLASTNIVLDSNVRVGLLSIGQKQLLMVARALSKKPRVLILDEPTTSLTSNEVDNLFKILIKLRDRGTSIILVTHKMEEIFGITDRVTILRDGNYISSYSRENYNQEKIVTDMVGRKISNLYPARNVKIGSPVLKVENLTVEHPTIARRNIIEGVSFELSKGEILGIAGLIGSGRTEILSAIFGRIKHKTGRITLNDREIKIQNEKNAMNHRISLVTEDRKHEGLLMMSDIVKNITVNNLKRVSKAGVIKLNYEKNYSEKFFKIMGVKAKSVNAPVIDLSGGNQQKVIIGRALNTEPIILLLDEPTKGIDVGSKNDMYHLMNSLVQKGVSIIMVSSELPELLGMCDRCIVMANGRVVGHFNKSEFSQEKIMLAATTTKTLAL